MFLMKNSSSTFWLKIATCRKKTPDDPKEKSITDDLEEEPITEDSKRTLSLGNLKRTISLRTLRSFRTLNNFCVAKKNSFAFLVMVYDRVDHGINFHMRILVLERLVFMLVFRPSFSVTNNVSYPMQETFLHQNIEIF